MGIRTTEEIDAERYALKLIRGDFSKAGLEGGQMDVDAIMEAVEANRYFAARRQRPATGRMPNRDITGECEGECRDRVREGEDERQAAINAEGFETAETSSAPGAEKRSMQQGVYGGNI